MGLTDTVKLLDGTNSDRMVLQDASSLDTMVRTMRDEAENFLGVDLVTGQVFPSESHVCDFGGEIGCTITSLGKNVLGVVITTQRCSSPRREGHRGRQRGSAASAPCGSSASTTRFVATSDTACGVA